MKKFIALAIALVMLVALAVPAFAATSGTTPVTYTVGETYAVVVPEALVVEGDAAEVGVSAINVNAGNAVKITATSTEWKLNGTYAYELSETEFTFTEVATEEVSATWAEDTVAPTAAGTYTDTVTFTGSIVAAE